MNTARHSDDKSAGTGDRTTWSCFAPDRQPAAPVQRGLANIVYLYSKIGYGTADSANNRPNPGGRKMVIVQQHPICFGIGLLT
ncbi:MAG: hypothetical protein A2521_07535 [Deltaproteobacteria bacterium RIFOXYD12_FULL_57_12]|nr:MAG: hypothetical protein A2521_07535 [Deltaproteobacteria bacterium RIFOXYD12_FULL_57_12]